MFKVGDRVKSGGNEACVISYQSTSSAHDGRSFCNHLTGMEVRYNNGNTEWTHIDGWQLITEEPMTVITALQQSITHWQEIVAVFGGAKVEDELHFFPGGPENCALCKLGRTKGSTHAPQNCASCPLGDCRGGSLYDNVEKATNNLDAFFASKAMLARLEELLVEEQAKKEEWAVRKGDMVVCTCGVDGTIGLREFTTKTAREEICEVLAVNGNRWLTLRESSGRVWDDRSDMTVVYRPTKEAK